MEFKDTHTLRAYEKLQKAKEKIMEQQAVAETQTQYVKMIKAKLLAKIKENRENHQQEYESAHGKWRTQQLEKHIEYAKSYDEYLIAAKAGGKLDPPDSYAFSLEEPRSHVKSYDRIIMMLEMSADDIYYLTHKDFDRYVLDNWEWKERFSSTVSNYR